MQADAGFLNHVQAFRIEAGPLRNTGLEWPHNLDDSSLCTSAPQQRTENKQHPPVDFVGVTGSASSLLLEPTTSQARIPSTQSVTYSPLYVLEASSSTSFLRQHPPLHRSCIWIPRPFETASRSIPSVSSSHGIMTPPSSSLSFVCMFLLLLSFCRCSRTWSTWGSLRNCDTVSRLRGVSESKSWRKLQLGAWQGVWGWWEAGCRG